MTYQMSKRGVMERRRQRGIALARRVSGALKKAGFEKAGRYYNYSPQDPGYSVFECGNGTWPQPTATILWIDQRAAGIRTGHLNDCIATVRAAGFTVDDDGKVTIEEDAS